MIRAVYKSFFISICVGLIVACTRCSPAAVYRDDFSHESGTWMAGAGWSLAKTPSGASCYASDGEKDSFAWRKDWRVGQSWVCEVDVSIRNERSGIATCGIAFSKDGTEPYEKLLVNIQRHSTPVTLVRVEYRAEKWRTVLATGWMPGGDSSYNIKVERRAGSSRLSLTVLGDKGLNWRFETPDINPSVLNGIAFPGLRAGGGEVQYTYFSLTSPFKAPDGLKSMAIDAGDDLLKHYWTGGPSTGHIINTYAGVPGAELPLERGGLWERATLLITLENLYRATGDRILKERIASDWRRTKSLYTADELKTPGVQVHPGVDDCGWDAWMYLMIHRCTGDQYALECAKALVSSSFDRWLDDKLGGGMWYNDDRKCKSLYAIGVMLSSMRIYEVTRDEAFLKRARSCYDWIEENLLRPDGLYWCDRNSSGPIGADRPDDIREAGSVTFLGGNMGMGVMHAMLYRITGQDIFRKRAIRTADAIAAHLTDGKGVLLDDRDAWANGTFVGEWAVRVLNLPGIDKKHRELLINTARAIRIRARTPDGYYGGCWNGPPDGPGSPWSVVGSRPQQIMTSAGAVNVIAAAALLDSVK